MRTDGQDAMVCEVWDSGEISGIEGVEVCSARVFGTDKM